MRNHPPTHPHLLSFVYEGRLGLREDSELPPSPETYSWKQTRHVNEDRKHTWIWVICTHREFLTTHSPTPEKRSSGAITGQGVYFRMPKGCKILAWPAHPPIHIFALKCVLICLLQFNSPPHPTPKPRTSCLQSGWRGQCKGEGTVQGWKGKKAAPFCSRESHDRVSADVGLREGKGWSHLPVTDDEYRLRGVDIGRVHTLFEYADPDRFYTWRLIPPPPPPPPLGHR